MADRIIKRDIDYTCKQCGSDMVVITTSVLHGQWTIGITDTLVQTTRHCQQCNYNEAFEDMYSGKVAIQANHYVHTEQA